MFVQLRLMKSENSVADNIHSELFAVSVYGYWHRKRPDGRSDSTQLNWL